MSAYLPARQSASDIQIVHLAGFVHNDAVALARIIAEEFGEGLVGIELAVQYW